MVRQSGIGDIEFFLYLADDEPIGMSGQEELHDAEPGLGAHGGEHVGVFGDLLGGFLSSDGCHISIVAETWVYCQAVSLTSCRISIFLRPSLSCAGGYERAALVVRTG